MEVIIRPDAATAVDLVARLIEERVRQNPQTVLGLATGRTMEQVYLNLLKRRVSFKQCTSFNLDEYIGLAADDPQSYRHYMQEHLFSKTDFQPQNTHVPEGDADDLDKAANHYEQLISDAGGIDLQLLGIGEAGHIGFNEPLSAIMSRTRDKCLTPTTRQQNAAMFGGDPERVPKASPDHGRGNHTGGARNHSAGHRQCQGCHRRPGGRRPDHVHGQRIGPATAPQLQSGSGSQFGLPIARQGIL